MFKTKKDVDRHVSHILSRIREEKERNSRGYQFAKLYFDVADYETAKRYMQAFLSVRETVPQAHKLMGQIYEAQKDKNKALEAFKRSLDLDPEQKDIVLKVCELYADVGVNVNKDIAKFWIEQAEKYYPNHQTVFKLKERLVDTDGTGDTEELEHLISQELLKNPGDVKLHVKFLRLLVQSRDVDRAYEHAVTTEKTLAFVSSADWYECLADVFQVYEEERGIQDETSLYIHKLFAMAMLTFLRLSSDDRDVLGAAKALRQLDDDLYVASNLRRHTSEWESYLTEIKGQLFYLMALVLLKRALKGQISWKDSSSWSTVCFLLSDTCQPIDTKSSWYCQAKPEWRKFYDRIYMSGCDRLSQGGHMIYSLLSKQDGGQWTKKLRQKLCTPQGKTTLYNLVMSGADVGKGADNSFFLNSDMFTSTSLDIPTKSDLLQHDGVAYSLHGADLNHIVWLALQHYSLKDDVQPDYEQLFGYQLYPEMKYSISDLSGGDPGTMSQLDIQVFLYTCVRWAALQNRDLKRSLHTISDKPDLLPPCLSTEACNKHQVEFWQAVDIMERRPASGKLSKLYGVVMRGLEHIRLVIPNALSLPLVVHVAKTLDARAHEIESLDAEGIVTPKLSAMQARAAFYWTSAQDMIERIDRNSSIRAPKEQLFPSDGVLDPAIVKDIREQVKFAMATVAMKQENYKEALSAFESLYKAEASYFSGLIYRKLAEDQDTNQNSSSGGAGGAQSHQIALLNKAKTSLYQALDRLEAEQNEELKDSVRRDLDDVVCKLISLESGGPLVDSILSNASQNYDTAESDVDSENSEPVKHVSQKSPGRPLLSQSRDAMRMSPTRVDVQLRALETANGALSSRLSTLEETMKSQSNLIQEIFIQLRQSRDENKNLRDQLQILSLQGLSGMSMVRAPGTPQHPPRMNPMNMSFGQPPMYDYPGQNGLPPHMSQYGYSAPSPRPGSAFGHPGFEDGFSNIDGEYYDPDNEGDFYPSDQNLVQEWPFGHKAGVEGKSTITYTPQQHPSQMRGMNPGNAGMYANALRGQSIQYGANYSSLVPPQQQGAQMPGPGFFSQNNPMLHQPSVQTQAGLIQGQFGMAQKSGQPGSALSPLQLASPGQQKAAAPPATVSKPTTPMMPPNAVIASQASEAKPTLIPGSVGVPAMTSSTGAATSKPGLQGSSVPQGQSQTGSASSILSSLAAKHQEEAKGSSPAVSTPQKTVFKGFSFTSTPKITEPKAEEKKPQDVKPPVTTGVAAPKPFSGFSLTPSKPAASTPKVTESNQSASASGSQGAGSLFSSFGQGSSPSFGSLAAQGQTADAFKASGDGKGFAGTGTPLFGKTPPRRHNTSTGSDDHIEEYEPNVDFKPVIQLPDLIEVKTGEEEEEKMFCERAKLFRFDTEANQWKERGIGEMKILRHRQTKTVRILMRREQVLKICANHKISPDMKLAPMSTSDRAWVWNALDFSEGEMKAEKLAVKFKTVDSAEKFKTAFEKCQAEMLAKPGTSTKVQVTSEATKVKETSTKPVNDKCDLAELFKPKAGSWTCDGCYVQNGGEVLKCLCCGTLKPGVKKEDLKEEPKSAGFGSKGISFGAQPGSSSGFKFGTQPSDASSTTPSGTGFKFGSSPAAAGSHTTEGSGFRIGSQQQGSAAPTGTGFSFSSPAATSAATSGTGFKFVSPSTTSTPTVPFGTKPAVPASTEATSIFGSKPTPGTTSSIFGGKPASPFTFGGNVKQEADSTTKVENKDSEKVKDEKSSAGESLLAKFLSSPDSWTCDNCHLSNEGMLEKCLKCEGPRTVGKTSSVVPKSVSSKTQTVKPSDKGAEGFQFGQAASAKSETSKEKDGQTAFSFVTGSENKATGFQFTTPVKSTAEGFKFTFAPSSDDEKPQPAASLGSGFNFSMSMTPLGTKKVSPIKTPTGAVPKTTSIMSPKSPEVNEEGFYVNKEGDDSHIHFEPVIELPDHIEVKTGEEGEDVIFTHRAKLFRFTNGEWKERGLGDVKVLYQPEKNKARIVMRREQILKLCCNHKIQPDLKFTPMPNSKGCALVWFAMDFAEGEPKSEQFSIKFKSEEIAKKFESAVEEAKSIIRGEKSARPKEHKPSEVTRPAVETLGAASIPDTVAGAASDGDVVIVREEKCTEEEIRKARQLQLPDHFFMYLRKPPCPGCLGCHEEVPAGWGLPKSGNMHSLHRKGPEQQQQHEQGADDEDDDNDDDDDYEDDDDADEDDDYEDEAEGEDTEKTSEEAGATGGFVFGGSSSQFSFASLAAGSGTSSFKTGNSGQPFHWQGAGKQLFGGSSGGGADEGSGDEGDVQQGDDPHFEPIVPLPDLVDVKTGEEDEVVEFGHRAKLFRFDKDGNQWKEKGIGEMKILKHKIHAGKYRLLMRREQVHKLACNNLLTPDVKFTPMMTSETAWCWTAQDYSDGEPKVEQLAVKFKSIELAKAFKAKIDEIQNLLQQGS